MSTNLIIWLVPALSAFFLYGLGQGFVKKYISEAPPSQFCLYFVVAETLVNLGYFFSQNHPPPFAHEGHSFLISGVTAYILDGSAWILYFESIVAGPITIVGTLSAAYPALTVLFARIFLAEVLTGPQYFGVVLVIMGCIGLSYAPADSQTKIKDKRWVIFAGAALILWGTAQTIVKYSYHLPGASEANLALFNTFGGVLTLGLYGLIKSKGRIKGSRKEWVQSFVPMGMMAAGDLFVIIASKYGPISIVTPLTGAYPLVTLLFATVVLKEKITRFQWVCITLILCGMVLSPG